jgi:DNA-binding GntR family transcriptional regulator
MTTTAGHDAERRIGQQILSGALPPGARLSQSQLAEELGMSRIPVRDALQRLAAEGLVELRPNASATVAPLSRADLEELYELRTAVEPHLCELATPLLTPEDLAAMERELARMARSKGPQSWLDANNAFHAILYRRAPRPRMVEIVDRARQLTDRYSRLVHEHNVHSAQSEHRLIIEAARNEESVRLASLVRAHLASGYETMLAFLAGNGLVADGASERT